MSVIMGLRMTVDAGRFEQLAQDKAEKMREIAERGKQHGAIHHRFYASESGDEVLVVDEWPDAESFQKFFSSSPDVGELMQEAGVTNQPQPVFWRELDTGDKF